MLPELEDVNDDDPDKIESKHKYNNNYMPYFENTQSLNQIESTNNNHNANILSNMMKQQESIKGRHAERDNSNNMNMEENFQKNYEKEKMLETKKSSSKNNNENDFMKMPLNNRFDGSIPLSNNDDRKFFVRNSMMPPNFHNLLNVKSGKRESNVKQNEVEKRNSLEEKNQILIEHFRNMLKEASSTM